MHMKEFHNQQSNMIKLTKMPDSIPEMNSSMEMTRGSQQMHSLTQVSVQSSHATSSGQA